MPDIYFWIYAMIVLLTMMSVAAIILAVGITYCISRMIRRKQYDMTLVSYIWYYRKNWWAKATLISFSITMLSMIALVILMVVARSAA